MAELHYAFPFGKPTEGDFALDASLVEMADGKSSKEIINTLVGNILEMHGKNFDNFKGFVASPVIPEGSNDGDLFMCIADKKVYECIRSYQGEYEVKWWSRGSSFETKTKILKPKNYIPVSKADCESGDGVVTTSAKVGTLNTEYKASFCLVDNVWYLVLFKSSFFGETIYYVTTKDSSYVSTSTSRTAITTALVSAEETMTEQFSKLSSVIGNTDDMVVPNVRNLVSFANTNYKIIDSLRTLTSPFIENIAYCMPNMLMLVTNDGFPAKIKENQILNGGGSGNKLLANQAIKEVYDGSKFCNTYILIFKNEISQLTSSPSWLEGDVYSAFSELQNIYKIFIPSKVIDAGYGLFSGCYSLSSIEVSEDNKIYKNEGNALVKIENKELIAGCKSSEIVDGIKKISSYAFSKTALEEIEIPESVTSIGKMAFMNSYLKKVTIKGKPSFSLQCFNCPDLTEFRLLSSEPPTYTSRMFGNVTGFSIIVPNGCAEVYKTAEGWSDFADYITEEESTEETTEE